MARTSADTSTSEIMSPMPSNTVAKARIVEMEDTTSKVNEDGTGGNPMYILTWVVDEGAFAGRRVGFHYIMYGGHDKHGAPMSLSNLLRLIDAIKAPWAANQSDPLVARPFKWTKLPNGNVACFDPDTNQILTNVDYNFPDDFINRQALVRFGQRKAQGSDRIFNEVVSVSPIP
jgi:hypothetical protein